MKDNKIWETKVVILDDTLVEITMFNRDTGEIRVNTVEALVVVKRTLMQKKWFKDCVHSLVNANEEK